MYKSTITKVRELNHFNRIKTFVQKGLTIEDYKIWFKIYHENMIKKYSKLFKKKK